MESGETPPPARTDISPPLVLVIDDDPDSRETIVHQLTSTHQYQVLKLSESRQAVSKVLGDWAAVCLDCGAAQGLQN